jgi:phage terminase large subunit
VTTALTLEAILDKAKEIEADPKRFAVYADDPVGFVDEVLGISLWEAQKDVLRAMVDNRRVAVRSGHGTGKTYVTACSVLWWLYARQGLVITTAPTWNHVEAVLWREINEIALRAPVKLPCLGEFQTERRVEKHWFALGLSTTTPSAFQGFHHARLLVVVDEAPGVAEQVHLEIGTLAVGEKNCILMIGNPTTTAGTFYEAFKHPDVWKCMRISCLDHPNVLLKKEVIAGAVTQSWINDKQREWGESHPFWYSRVLGEFPKISNRGVIPLGWLERAQNEEKRKEALSDAEAQKIPRVGGLDVARYGDNQCVLTIRRGDAIERQEAWGNLSLMETVGIAARAIADYDLKALVIDAAGVGAGVYDRLLELRHPVYAYNGGHRAFTPGSFNNRRTEMWWGVRTRLEKQRLWLPPNCERLVADLIAPEYEIASSGRIQIETKEKLLDRGIRSPDYADSLILCYALDENPEAELEPKPSWHQDPMKYEVIVGSSTEDHGQFPEYF